MRVLGTALELTSIAGEALWSRLRRLCESRASAEAREFLEIYPNTEIRRRYR